MKAKTITDQKHVAAVNPKKFALWLFLVSITMVFVSLSSAYIVKKGIGEWVNVDFPPLFKLSTFLIVLSSISIHFSYISAKRDRIRNVQWSLIITGLLGIGFTIAQFKAWGQLVEGGFYFVGNPASSFVYVFTGIHVIHLFAAIIFLFFVMTNAFNYKVHSKNMLNIELCATFWHFLGAIWIYLYLFFIYYN